MQEIQEISLSQPVYIYYHTHWDREWYLPFREYQHRLIKVVDKILDVLETEKLQCFTLDGQTVLLEDYLEFRPENRDRIKTLVRQNRVSIGPWYVMPDEFLVSGESLIRNLQRGLSLSREFGEETFTGYLPDTFGHSADIPMLLRQFGIRSAIIWRGVKPMQPLFYWNSPSGDAVLTYHLTEGYFQNVFHMGENEDEQYSLVSSWLNKMSGLATAETPLLFPVGADHLGVVPDAEKALKNWVPQAQPVTPDHFMAESARIIGDATLPVLEGELRDSDGPYILPGVFSSRMYLKQWNRRFEWRLTRQLEQLISWEGLLGLSPNVERELDTLWKTLLLNHPHDSICGCSVDSVHRENETRFEQIDQLSTALIRDAHHEIRSLLQPKDALLLLNLGDAPYTGTVEIQGDYPLSGTVPEAPPHCQVISEEILLDDSFLVNPTILPLSENKMLRRKCLIWADNIPAHGIQHVFEPLAAPDEVVVTPHSMQNEQISVKLDPDGSLTVTDFKTGRTYSQLHSLWRNAEQGDSYNAAPVPGTQPEQAVLLETQVFHTGPLRGVIALKWLFKSIALSGETLITLQAGSSRLDFHTRFVNNTSDHKIQVFFKARNPIQEVIAEGHFAPVNRKTDPEYRIEAYMPAPKFKELMVQGGAIQRFIGLQDQTLITLGLAEYEVENDNLKLTLHRAFGMLSRDDTGVRGSHAGPPLPTPEGQCLNRLFDLEYAWLPDFDLTRAFHQADNFYGAVYGFDRKVEPSSSHPAQSRPFFSWDNLNLHTSAVIPTSIGFELRLVNPTAEAQRGILQIPGKTFQTTRILLDGTPMGTAENNALEVPAYSIQTLAIQVK
jgi:mannosylglycerate hydrolase